MPQVNVTALKGLVQEAGKGGLFVEGLAGAGALAPTATPDTITPGATATISVTTTSTLIENTEATAATLPDGLAPAQLKRIRNNAGSVGSVTLTPSSFANGTTITIIADQDILLMWTGSTWVTLQMSNAVIA